MNDDVPYEVATAILDVALSALTPEELKPFSSFVSHGPAVEDCPLLIAYPVRLYPGFGIDGQGRDMGVYVYLLDAVISLRDAAAIIDNKDNLPTPEENDDFAKLMSKYTYKIVKALNCARREGRLMPNSSCEFSMPPIAEIVEEQGMFAGWDITITAQLP